MNDFFKQFVVISEHVVFLFELLYLECLLRDNNTLGHVNAIVDIKLDRGTVERERLSQQSVLRHLLQVSNREHSRLNAHTSSLLVALVLFILSVRGRVLLKMVNHKILDVCDLHLLLLNDIIE